MRNQTLSDVSPAVGIAIEPGRVYDACTRMVSHDYLEALGVPLRRGRHFDATDGPESLPVLVVNETMERQYFGGDAVGRRLKIGDADQQTPWMTVPPIFFSDPMTVRMSPQTVQSSRPALSMQITAPSGTSSM